MQNSYKKSGVNISLANKLVKHIAKLTNKNVKKTNNLNKNETIGGFGSLFDISKIKIRDPIIVSCTDGVGTKIELANKFKKFDTTHAIVTFCCAFCSNIPHYKETMGCAWPRAAKYAFCHKLNVFFFG